MLFYEFLKIPPHYYRRFEYEMNRNVRQQSTHFVYLFRERKLICRPSRRRASISLGIFEFSTLTQPGAFEAAREKKT